MESLSAQQATEIVLGTTTLSVTLALLMMSKGLATREEVVGAVNVALDSTMHAHGAGPLTVAVVESFNKAICGYPSGVPFHATGATELTGYRM